MSTDRAWPGVAALAVVAGLALAGCGGSHAPSARDRASAWLTQAQKIQVSAGPAFTRIQGGYTALATSKRALTDADVKRIDDGEKAIRTTRNRLARLSAPTEVAGVRRALLHVYDLDATFAHQTTLLARYSPASAKVLGSLDKADKTLSAGLGKHVSVRRQARVLGAYAQSVHAVLRRLSALTPPKILRATHLAEIRRLNSTRTLALSLRNAIVRHQSRRVARLLLKFRELSDHSGDAAALQRAAIQRYNARLTQLQHAETAVDVARVQLDKRLK